MKNNRQAVNPGHFSLCTTLYDYACLVVDLCDLLYHVVHAIGKAHMWAVDCVILSLCANLLDRIRTAFTLVVLAQAANNDGHITPRRDIDGLLQQFLRSTN